MKTNELIEFLYDLNLAGYASGEEKKWTKENDCSTTIPFKKGKFRSHDNFSEENHTEEELWYFMKKNLFGLWFTTD